jgi:hypothetical protein
MVVNDIIRDIFTPDSDAVGLEDMLRIIECAQGEHLLNPEDGTDRPLVVLLHQYKKYDVFFVYDFVRRGYTKELRRRTEEWVER